MSNKKKSRPFSKLPNRTELARELRCLARARAVCLRDVWILVTWWSDDVWICGIDDGFPVHEIPDCLFVLEKLPIPLHSSTCLAMDIRDQLADKRDQFYKEKDREEARKKQEAEK